MSKIFLPLFALLSLSSVAFADDAPAEDTHKSMSINFAQLTESTIEDGNTLVISVPFLADTCNTAGMIGGWEIDHENKTVEFKGQVVQTLRACGGPVKKFTIYLESETDEIFLPEDGTWEVIVPNRFEEDFFRRPWINDFNFGWTKSNTIYQILFN